jgi:large conductance mechanosensitive channel
MKKFLNDFKVFVLRGNVMDMAIGIVVGAAFTAIITSLVNDIIMPIIGVLTAGINFSDLKAVISEAVYDDAGNIIRAETAINYGAFVQNVIYFLIIAFICFVTIRVLTNSMKKAEKLTKAAAGMFVKNKDKQPDQAQKEEPKPPEPTETEKLLAEIRDLLIELKNKE